MHRSLRMLGILLDLQDGSKTLAQLAGKYECSTKTIQRDITELAELNIPVVSTSGAGGGISLDPSWMLGPMNLTPGEIETLVLALENASHLPDAAQTLAKIRSAAKPGWFDAVAENPSRPQALNRAPQAMPEAVTQIRSVMQRDLWCRIDYAGGSNPGWRIVLPNEVRLLEGRWYLWAIDERSHEIRNFRIDRVRAIEPILAPTNAAEIIANAEIRPAYGSETYPEVVVELTDAGVTFCRDHHHFHRHIHGNVLRFRCPPSDYRYVAMEIMRMGIDCRVIAPPELVSTLRTVLSELGHHYEN